MTTIVSSLSIFSLAQIVPIPDYTGTYLPAPAWLLEVLLLVTFWVHQLFVAATLGAVLVLFVRSCCHLATTRAISLIDKSMIRSIPPVLSLTITTGIAPLLFVQTLYGHYSYSSNILMGYFWLSSLVLLLVGFVCLYFSGWLWNWKISVPALAILPICFLGIAYIYTNNAILTIQPEHWLVFHRHNSLLHVKDPITIPRFLNNISYSLIIGGLFLVWATRVAGKSQAAGASAQAVSTDGTIRWGILWHGMGLAVMTATGIWYYHSMPVELQTWLFGSRVDNLIFGNMNFILAVMVVFGLFFTLMALAHPRHKRWTVASTILSALLVGIMVLIREQIRRWYLARELAGGFSIDNWPVQSQDSAIAVFLVCFVIALLVIAIMLFQVLRPKSLDA